MKGLIDTNILAYSTIRSLPEFPRAKDFLASALSGPDAYAVTWINVAEYLSFLTNSWRDRPAYMTIGDALANANELLKNPCLSLIEESESHWDSYKKVLNSAGIVKGRFVHDCRIAAIMMENGVDTIFTRDSEFRRIPGIKVVDPIVTHAVP